MSGEPPPLLHAAPVASGDRIEALDVLRGVAVLGILVMNIQSFSMVDAAYFNPNALGPLEGVEYAVWILGHLFFDQKFITLFSMLFGAGIVLLATRCEHTDRAPAAIHYRRMSILLLVGLVHAYVLWHGDILVTYALCGCVAYWFRRVPPWLLYALGLAAMAVPSVGMLIGGWAVAAFDSGTVGDIAAGFAPSAEAIAREVATMQGTWWDQMELRAANAFAVQTSVLLFYLAWRCGGTMLIGMALYKQNVLTAQRTNTFYATMVAAGLCIGLPIVGIGAYFCESRGWEAMYAKFVGSQYNYWASLLLACGWTGVVMLLCRAGALTQLRTRLAAVGRMALTNYLLQSVLCTTLFYGHGLGWFGQLDRVEQLGVVGAVWAIELALSPLWLRAFRYGPAEWLWRALTYLRWP